MEEIADDIEHSLTKGLNPMLVLMSNLNNYNTSRRLSKRVESMKNSAKALTALTEHLATSKDYDGLRFDEVMNAMLHYMISAHMMLNEKDAAYKEMTERSADAVGAILMGLASGQMTYSADDCDECDCDERTDHGKYKRDHEYRDPGIC